MKLTKNQEAIKEFGESVGIWITTNRKEKQMWWDSDGQKYECEQCGKERQIGEPWEETYICYKCFNSHKLPFVSYDTSTYSNSYTSYDLLTRFIGDKPIDEVKAGFDEMKKGNEE